jgi:hypothetical protein
MVCARRDFPISRLTSDQHDSTVAGLHLLPAPHQQREVTSSRRLIQKTLKKADELNQQMAELAGKLGPEYIALVAGLQAMDPDSKGSKEIDSTLDALDKLCAK